MTTGTNKYITAELWNNLEKKRRLFSTATIKIRCYQEKSIL